MNTYMHLLRSSVSEELVDGPIQLLQGPLSSSASSQTLNWTTTAVSMTTKTTVNHQSEKKCEEINFVFKGQRMYIVQLFFNVFCLHYGVGNGFELHLCLSPCPEPPLTARAEEMCSIWRHTRSSDTYTL